MVTKCDHVGKSSTDFPLPSSISMGSIFSIVLCPSLSHGHATFFAPKVIHKVPMTSQWCSRLATAQSSQLYIMPGPCHQKSADVAGDLEVWYPTYPYMATPGTTRMKGVIIMSFVSFSFSKSAPFSIFIFSIQSLNMRNRSHLLVSSSNTSIFEYKLSSTMRLGLLALPTGCTSNVGKSSNGAFIPIIF